MKKLLIAFSFLFFLSGCSNEKVEVSTENHDDVVLFTVKSDGYMGAETSYEEFNKQLNKFFETYKEEKDVVATFVEPNGDFVQHTMTVYYFADTIIEDLSSTPNPIKFADYRNSTAEYSESNDYITNRSAANDERVNDLFFNIGIGEYQE